MLSKPRGCAGCSLEFKGTGFAPPVGPENAEILIVGEALGRQEAYKGEPFVGPSGESLNGFLRACGISREQVRIANVISCQPPGDWLDGAPWEQQAINHCSQYLEPVLKEPHKVIITLGGTATRRLLDLPKKGHKQNDWHGTVNETRHGLVVPTFHPAYINRGNQKLIGTVIHDIQKAIEVSRTGFERDKPSLVVDPPIEWFGAWVSEYLDALREGIDPWLAVDIETNGKAGQDEGELKDSDEEILRINFAVSGEEGVTVPFRGLYVPLVRELLSSPGIKAFWNSRFDVPRLRKEGCPVSGKILDFMWAWHVLQSDLPRGLGFVAPFYSKFGAWKHFSSQNPGLYAAIDAIQTHRLAYGIARDLEQAGQWETFLRHVEELDRRVLFPAEEIGLLVDKEKLERFREDLQRKEEVGLASIQALVPEGILQEKEWKKEKQGLAAGGERVIKTQLVRVCKTCGASQVVAKHKCKGKEFKKLNPLVCMEETQVYRWVKKLDFNPNSPLQILDYMTLRGHKGGKAKKSKSGKPSTDAKTLAHLAKTTKDPFYKTLLDFRKVGKILGTYVEGSQKRLWSDGRLHPQFLHKPSTLRLSCVNPNLQNVVADRGGAESLAAGFRSCLVPASGNVFVEADFSAIEAVETGWFAGDHDYIRLAKLGVHAYLTSHYVKKPADLRWSDEDLGKHFNWIKEKYDPEYNVCKRVVHGVSYGLTVIGLVNNYPELFTRTSADKIRSLFLSLCPKLGEFQSRVVNFANRHHYLGGQDHPFGYKHWFWNIKEDAKRAIAYYPQSTAAGVIKEAALRLMDPDGGNYIGELFNGRTPIRALVHDSILLEVPVQKRDFAIQCLVNEMTKPIMQQPLPVEWKMGSHLSIGVAVKSGFDWLKMEKVKISEIGVASDTKIYEEEEEDEEEIA